MWTGYGAATGTLTGWGTLTGTFFHLKIYCEHFFLTSNLKKNVFTGYGAGTGTLCGTGTLTGTGYGPL